MWLLLARDCNLHIYDTFYAYWGCSSGPRLSIGLNCGIIRHSNRTLTSTSRATFHFLCHRYRGPIWGGGNPPFRWGIWPKSGFFYFWLFENFFTQNHLCQISWKTKKKTEKSKNKLKTSDSPARKTQKKQWKTQKKREILSNICCFFPY